MKILLKIILINVTVLFLTVGNAFPYKGGTHILLNTKASNSSNIDSYLINQLGFSQGINTSIYGLIIEEWLTQAGAQEDSPLKRTKNHFHNPLAASWDVAGLDKPVQLLTGKSSILWAQDQSEIPGMPDPILDSGWAASDIGSDWSWPLARKFYIAALSGNSMNLDNFLVQEFDGVLNRTQIIGKERLGKIEKDKFFAWTFRSLGQLTHLIEDSSVPEHIRNDAHIIDGQFSNNYELALKEFADSKNGKYVPDFFNFLNDEQTISEVAPDISILTLAPNSLAPIPIARLVDTETYKYAPDADITTSNTIGIAEYTNANFFSEDTIPGSIFGSEFPYPEISSCTIIVQREVIHDSGDSYMRSYFEKPGNAPVGCGENNSGQGYLLAAVDGLDYWRQNNPILASGLGKVPVLDDLIYKDYAALLLPRAVGYSSALLDYFFRGKIEISSITPYDIITRGNGGDGVWISGIKTDIRNATMDLGANGNPTYSNEAMGPGSITAVAHYTIGPNVEYSVSREEPANNIIPHDTSVEFVFDFTGDPIPWNLAKNISIMVIFKGTLGGEQNIAVAVGRQELFNGKLEASSPTEYVYSIIDTASFYDAGGNPLPQFFDTVKASLQNMVAGKDMTLGTLTAVAAYKNRINYQPDLSTDPPTSADRESFFTYSTSDSIDIATILEINTAPTDVEFNFATEPIPAGITDLYLYVVFEGTLHNTSTGADELDAVVVGIKDLNEPQHFSFWNSTDYFLLDGIPKTPAEISVDPYRGDYGHYESHNLIEAVAFTDDQFATGLPALINMELTPGQYSKFIFLTDASDTFYLADYVDDPDDTNSDMPLEGITYPNYPFLGVVNQMQNDGLWYNALTTTSRGVRQNSYTFFINFHPDLYISEEIPNPNNDLKPVPATWINFPQ